jgi:hypothetical protein
MKKKTFSLTHNFVILSTHAMALDLAGPGLTTVIIFPNDSVDTSTVANAGLFQRHLGPFRL